jgi:hypothetical protein
MIDNFKYIFSPQESWNIIGDVTKPENIFAYGYLMQHQYCKLIVFDGYTIIDSLRRILQYNRIETDNNFIYEFYNDKIDIDEIIYLFNILCLKVEILDKSEKYLKINTETIFSNEELEYNSKRFYE